MQDPTWYNIGICLQIHLYLFFQLFVIQYPHWHNFCLLNTARSSACHSFCSCCFFCLNHLLPSIFLYSCLLLLQDSVQILPPHQRTSLITLDKGVLSFPCYHYPTYHFYWPNNFLKLACFLFFVFITFFTSILPTKTQVSVNIRCCIPRDYKCTW